MYPNPALTGPAFRLFRGAAVVGLLAAGVSTGIAPVPAKAAASPLAGATLVAPVAGREAPASAVRLGRLHYGGGGDWYANPTSLPNLARALRERLGMEVEIEDGRPAPLDEELFDYPLLHMTGHGNVRFTSEEAERLRWYLVHGGFLFADDNYGMDESFRREIRKVFPEAELVEVPFDHEIFHNVYEFPKGSPKIHQHHGGAPRAYAMFHEGRMVVFYTYNTDIGDGLEDGDVHDDPPDVREQALRMAINVVAYAMTH